MSAAAALTRAKAFVSGPTGWARAYFPISRFAFIFATTALVSAFLLASCDEQEPIELDVAIASPIQSVDPTKAGDPLTIQVLGQIYETLIKIDSDGELAPALAASWGARDGEQTWRITLRESRATHGGASLSAHDVKRALEELTRSTSFNAYVLNGVVEGAGAFSSGEADQISGISVVDESTLQFSLTRPEPAFAYRLAHPGLLIFSQNEDGAFRGTGPFELAALKDGGLQLKRFSGYPRASSDDLEALVQTLRFRRIGNPQFWYQAVASGEIDLAILSRRYLPQTVDDDTVEITEWTPFNVRFLGFNLDRVGNESLRQAIAARLDRDSLVQQVADGAAVAAYGFAPSDMKGYELDRPAPQSADTLRSIVSESGYDGRPLQLTVHDRGLAEDIGLYVKTRLRDIGVEIEISKVDFQTALNRMVKGETDLYVMHFDYSYAHPNLILDAFLPENIPVPNFWRYRPSEALVADITSIRRNEIEVSAVKAVEGRILSDMPAVFLFSEKQYVVTAPRFDGIVLTPVNQIDLSSLTQVQ